MYLQSALWCSVALLPALSLVAADIIYNGDVCDLTENENDWWWDGFVVESQAAFDATLGNCTTIIGPLFISPNYTGSFVMNNVTNMTGDLITSGSVWENYTTQESVATNPSALLTSIQADNLVWLNELALEGVPALNSISMARLDTISSLVVYSNPIMSLSFPRLRNSSEIIIYGGYSSLNFDQLANVDQTLSIGTTNDTSGRGWENWEDLTGKPAKSSPIDIKLPSLINATYIELWGNISSLYMPSLTTSILREFQNPLLHYYHSGISINNYALQSLNVSLPKLRDATSIAISGGLGSVSLPALTNWTGDYHIFASKATPLVMNFDPLHAAGSIWLFGKIKSVNISSIQSINALTVSGTDPINCGGLGAEYAKIKNSTQTSEEKLSAMGFSCSFPPKKKRPLSAGGYIGVGLGIFVLAIAFVWFAIWMGKKKNAKREADGLPSYHLARLDPAPKYPHASTPEESTEGGENGGPTTPAREETVEGFHPPTYDALSGQAGENEGGQSREARTDHRSVS